MLRRFGFPVNLLDSIVFPAISELFKYRGAAPAADGGLISGRTRIQRGNNERQESGGLSPRITSTVLKVRGSGTEEFAQVRESKKRRVTCDYHCQMHHDSCIRL